jgi:type VI secretion system protein ImpA
VTADVVVAVPMHTSAQEGPLQSRAQALAQLRAVADYFRRTEPHSPVAYLADKAAHWGEQPLHVWLRSVVKDDAAFAHIEEMLGVGTRPS